MSDPKKINSALNWIGLSILIIVIDQIVKHLAVTYLPFNQAVPITSFFNLALTHNTGAAFSFLANVSWAPWVLGGLALVMSIGILYWLKQTPSSHRWLAISLTLILGGALGNLIDRLHQGYVIDFIQVYYKQWYWPTFNIADSAITIGAIMLAINVIWKAKK